MARTYSDKFLMHLFSQDSTDLEVRLAKICVKANLPTAYVAKALGVSRLTVFNWFRGTQIRKRYYPIIEAFMKILQEDLDKGVLPAGSHKLAKHYIETMLGKEI